MLDANPTSLHITQIKFGSAFGYTLPVNPTGLTGSVVYTINTDILPLVVDPNTLRYTQILDTTIGPFQFGECAFYAGSTLFAVGVSGSLISKVADSQQGPGNVYRLDLFTDAIPGQRYAVAELGTNAQGSFPRVPVPDLLTPPALNDNNAYIIYGLTQNDIPYMAFADPTGKWSFTTKPVVAYTGTVASTGSYGLLADAISGSFDGDITQCVLQFTSGDLRGYCRQIVSFSSPKSWGWNTPLPILPAVGDQFIINAPATSGYGGSSSVSSVPADMPYALWRSDPGPATDLDYVANDPEEPTDPNAPYGFHIASVSTAPTLQDGDHGLEHGVFDATYNGYYQYADQFLLKPDNDGLYAIEAAIQGNLMSRSGEIASNTVDEYTMTYHVCPIVPAGSNSEIDYINPVAVFSTTRRCYRDNGSYVSFDATTVTRLTGGTTYAILIKHDLGNRPSDPANENKLSVTNTQVRVSRLVGFSATGLVSGIIDSGSGGGSNGTTQEITDLTQRVTALETELTSNLVTLSYLQNTSVPSIQNTAQNAQTAVLQEINDRTADVNALQGSINDLITQGNDYNTRINDNATAIVNLGDSVNQDVATLNASLTSIDTARADGDAALAGQITTLTATVNSNQQNLSSQLTTESATRASADSALSTQITTLSTTVTNNYSSLNSAIQQVDATHTTAESTLATQINNLTSTVNTNNTNLQSSINSLSQTQTTNYNSLSDQITTLTSTVANDQTALTAAINSEASTRATADSANAAQTALVQAQLQTENLVFNPMFQPAGGGWPSGTFYSATDAAVPIGAPSGYVLYSNSANCWSGGTSITTGTRSPVTPSDTLELEVWVGIKTTFTENAGLQIGYLSQTGTDLGVPTYTTLSVPGSAAGWQKLSITVTIPSNAYFIVPNLWISKSGGSTAACFFALPSVRRQSGAMASVQQQLTSAVDSSGTAISQYTIKTYARSTDGKLAIAGIGLASQASDQTGVAQSEIILEANRLLLTSPNTLEGTTTPLLVAGQVNGVNTVVIPSTIIGDQTVGAQVLIDGAVTTRSIATGAVTATQLAADSVNAGSLSVLPSGGAGNLVQNGLDRDSSGWSSVEGANNATWQTATGSLPGCLQFNPGSGSGGYGFKAFPITAGETYLVRLRFTRGSGTSGTMTIRINWSASMPSGGYVTSTNKTSSSDVTTLTLSTYTAGSQQLYEGTVIAPTGVNFATFEVYFNATGASATASFWGPEFITFQSGVFIKNGTITAQQIDSRGLSIKDASGNVILAAGTPLSSSNINPSSGWLNSNITLSSSGALNGAGGGQVSLSGLGQHVFRVVSCGNNATTSVPVSPGLYKDGSQAYGAVRSYNMARIRRSDATVTFQQTYDVFGNGATTSGRNSATLAADLNATGADSIVVVWTYDEPQANRLTNGLDTAMYRCGASPACFGSPQFQYRGAYILIGIPGVGQGNGVEAYQGSIAADPNAWCDVSFGVTSGTISGVSAGYTPRSLGDFSYTGDLNATYGAHVGTTLLDSYGNVVPTGLVQNNLVDASWWQVGVSPTPRWASNQNGGSDSFANGTGWSGESGVFWRAVQGPAGNNGGGWNPGPSGNGNWFPVDTTKTYRFICPIYPGPSTHMYWGISGNTVCDLNTSNLNGNPYFANESGASLGPNKWYLLVGYVFPAGSTTNAHSGAGIYDLSTGALREGGLNYCWAAGTQNSGTRAYQFYANSGEVCWFGKPMVHVVNGSEPTLDSILSSGSISARNSINSGNASTYIANAAIQSAMIQDLRTANYSEDGSGNPTAGAKLSSTGTAIKVASGSFQLGTVIFTDYWARLVQGLDGGSGLPIIIRGNIDTSVRGGAPNIACLSVYTWESQVLNSNFQQVYHKFTITPSTYTTYSDNVDLMTQIHAQFFQGTAYSSPFTEFYLPCPSRTYDRVAGQVNGAWHWGWRFQLTGGGAVGPGVQLENNNQYSGYLRIRIANVYGWSATQDFGPNPNRGGQLPYATITGSSGSSGGGGGSSGGACPAPWVKIKLINGTYVEADNIYNGAVVAAVNDTTLEPIPEGGVIEHVNRIWSPRWRITLTDGTATEWSENHRIAVVNSGWVAVQDICPGDQLVAQKEAIVQSVVFVGDGQVISFLVKGAGTYFGDDLLCHNTKMLP